MIVAGVLLLLLAAAAVVWLTVAAVAPGNARRRFTFILWFLLPWAPYAGTTARAFNVNLDALPISAIAAALIVALAAMTLTARPPESFPRLAIPISVASLLMWAALFTCDLGSGIGLQLRPIAGVAALAAVLCTLSTNDSPLRGLRTGLISIALLSMIIGLAKSSLWDFADPTPKFPLPFPTPFGGRLAGLSYSPNHFGFVAATALVLFAFGPRSRLPLWVPGAVSLIAILLSGSRSSLIGLLAAGVIAFLVRGRKSVWWWVAGVGGIATSWLLLGQSLSNTKGIATLNGRQVIWDAVLASFPNHPIFGFGPGGWRTLVELNHLPAYAVEGHNQVIDTLGKGGMIGLLSLAAWVSVAVWSALRKSGESRVLPFALLGLVAGRSIFEAPLDIYLLGPATVTVSAVAASIAWKSTAVPSHDGHFEETEPEDVPSHSSRVHASVPA